MSGRSRSYLQDVLKDARILVVEDNERNQLLLRHVLESAGFTRLHFAEDGVAGLEAVMAVHPDLIILDLMMPRMDGEEMLRHLRAGGADSQVPVIVQTSADSAESRTKLFEAGATDFVGKPLNLREFLAKVRIHLENFLLLRSLETQLARLEEELSSARRMQRALLPRDELLARAAGLGVGVRSHFETSSELGGDLFGLRVLEHGRMLAWVADFSGHGVSSALNSFRLHTLMEGMGAEAAEDPAAALTRLNDELVELLPRGQFATMVLAGIDTEGRRLTLASAAGPRALTGAMDGSRLAHHEGAGLPLGIRRGSAYANNVLDYRPGDFLFLYSDGLSETPDLKGGLIGEDGVARMVRAALPGAVHPLDAVMAELFEYSARPPADDMTALWLGF